IYIDEQLDMGAAKDLLRSGSQGDYREPIGWSVLISIAFGLFGVNNWVAIYTALVIGAFTILPVFLLTRLVTGRSDAALVAALWLACDPIHIRWSACAKSNAASIFFIILVIYFSLLAFRSMRRDLLQLALAGMAFAVQLRQENYFLFVLFIAGWLLYRRTGPSIRSIVLPLALAVLLSLPNLVVVIGSHAFTDWQASDTGGQMSGSNWSLGNLIDNSLAFGPSLFDGSHQTSLFSVLVLFGISPMLRERRRQSLFLGIWFAILWLVYFTSWFQTLQGKERFFTSFAPVLWIFGARGALEVSRSISARIGRQWTIHLLVVIALAVATLNIPYARDHAAFYSDPHRVLMATIPERAEREIPADCIVVLERPTVLSSTTGFEVMPIGTFLTDVAAREEQFDRNACVLFFEDVYCVKWDIDGSLERCFWMRKRFQLTPFRTYEGGGVGYTFYRILPGA
ncbi:MAG: glycosyltransferase family 39 protein, partial [Candidatus Undinarchaeales archaeon]|nr:glycosyltransferase family 39 protein [Candidatus Undinarchaeales archaeon]